MDKDIYLEAIARGIAVMFHGDQMYGKFPYVKHLDDVVNVLKRFGFNESYLITAALLHDIIEDTKADVRDLQNAGISQNIIHIVMAVTDDKYIENRHDRKLDSYPRIAGNRDATVIKIADRIANAEMGDKIEMYRKEYPEFREALYKITDDPRIEEMWKYLDSLMK